MRQALQKLINKCHGDGSTIGCPILAALQGQQDH